MLLIVIIDLIDYYQIINTFMLLHPAPTLSPFHHRQELVNVDQTLAILIRHLDHLFYFTISNIYPQLPQNCLKIISTYFTVTVRILEIKIHIVNILGYWVLV